MAKRLKILQSGAQVPMIKPVNGTRSSESITLPEGRAADEPRMIRSPFQIDHRGEVIAELRADAATLREHARIAIERAGQLEAAAQHLEDHPPD